jgi:hypothetical protein
MIFTVVTSISTVEVDLIWGSASRSVMLKQAKPG